MIHTDLFEFVAAKFNQNFTFVIWFYWFVLIKNENFSSLIS